MLDLELCSPDGVQLPPDYTQESWTPATTTQRDGCIIYDSYSDIMQIGVMLKKLSPWGCSKLAKDFIQQLISKQLSAKAALQHDWLTGL